MNFDPNGDDFHAKQIDEDPNERSAFLKVLRGLWAGTEDGGTADLLDERRRERELEEGRAGRHGVGRPR